MPCYVVLCRGVVPLYVRLLQMTAVACPGGVVYCSCANVHGGGDAGSVFFVTKFWLGVNTVHGMY
jgi:hypothetical protein